MQQEIFGVESEYMKVKSLLMNFLCIYQELMLGIKDDSFCATLTITLTVGCFNLKVSDPGPFSLNCQVLAIFPCYKVIQLFLKSLPPPRVHGRKVC